MPVEITSNDFSLFKTKYIEADENKAERILNSIPQKISDLTRDYVKLIFLSCIDKKEIALMHFLKQGFESGANFIKTIDTGFGCTKIIVEGALENSQILKIQKGIDLLRLETQRFIQFVRFSEVDGKLVSIIEPQNNILPLLANHFTARYPNEQFLIYDKTHGLGLLYANHKLNLENISEYKMPPLSQKEKDYQNLWRMFYDTIAIKERKNHRCRQNFMPKKYWKNMTEFMAE